MNNIGLLATIWGSVAELDPGTPKTWLKVEDTSGCLVKVVVPDAVAISDTWQFVMATGISSCEKPGPVRVLKVRKAEDILVHLP